MRPNLPTAPSTVNGFPVLASVPATASPREICIYIVCEREPGDYVTWCYNLESGGAAHGHYGLETLAEAVADMNSRARL